MVPRIVKSELAGTRWYVVTRYSEKSRIDAETGEVRKFIVASKKYDVTDQMQVILEAERGSKTQT